MIAVTAFGSLCETSFSADALAQVVSNTRPIWTARQPRPSTDNRVAAPGTIAPGTIAPRAIAPRTIATYARPVSSAPPALVAARSTSPNTSQTVILKWRGRRPSAFGSTAQTTAQTTGQSTFQTTFQTTVQSTTLPQIAQAAAFDGPALTSASGHPVRQAVQLKPLDPFDDPFDDQMAAETDDPPPLPPATISLDPPAGLSQLEDQPNAIRSFLVSELSAGDADEPCQRVYNNRNCCKEDSKCKEARKNLKDRPITNIELDITPDCNAHSADARASRAWKDCDNNLLAVGSMTDFRNGRVVVSKSDGTIAELLYGQLSDDDLCFVAAWCGVPTECRFSDICAAQPINSNRQWVATTFTWTASALCHKPLYFEEVQLERYGHSAGPVLQPILSGAHFFINIAVLPYRMGINPPNECQYALGYYRPGSCAPWMVEPIPLSLRGGLMQAGAVTGGIFVLP